MSQMNQGFGSQAPGSGRPGQMTAVMRAMQQATGPKVLRIGLVAAGRILEERIVKQRTSVTVGPSEKSTFVVQANLPVQFKLFELIGGDYYLNFLDGMTGRIALATGITDLVALKGQAKRVGPAYQVRLTEEARGKIVIGEITFLFQFVAPPPVQPRPQLPLSVKGGVASQIDWSLTIIAAFSFLLHFGLVGAMYSDWMDPVVNDDITAGLLDMVQKTVPAADGDRRGDADGQRDRDGHRPGADAGAQAAGLEVVAGRRRPTRRWSPGLMNEADQARIAILAALNGGANIKGAMNDDNGAPVDLNSLANRSGGFTQQQQPRSAAWAAAVRSSPARAAAGCRTSTAANTGGASTTAGQATKVVPVGNVEYGGSPMSVPVSNAEAVIRSQIHPGAKRCYQRGLESDPTQAGKLVILIKVAPSGEVDSASASSNNGLSASVAACIVGRRPPREVRPARRERLEHQRPVQLREAGRLSPACAGRSSGGRSRRPSKRVGLLGDGTPREWPPRARGIASRDATRPAPTWSPRPVRLCV